MPYSVMMVFGARPEATKMAPVVRSLRQLPEIDLHMCVTGQHREMLHQVLEIFERDVEQDLAVMTRGQTLNGLTEQLLVRLDHAYDVFRPDLVLVHGDTTTSFVASSPVLSRPLCGI